MRPRTISENFIRTNIEQFHTPRAALVSPETVQHLPTEYMLSAKERAYCASLPERNRADTLAGRVALATAYGDEHHPLEVIYDTDGRPEIVGEPQLSCSIAHSGGWGAAVIHDRSVGIDVEVVAPRDEKLLDSVASEIERRWLDDMGWRGDEAITLLWTIKESVMKATGRGLSVSPRAIRVSPAKSLKQMFIVELDTTLWDVGIARQAEVLLATAVRKEEISYANRRHEHRIPPR